VTAVAVFGTTAVVGHPGHLDILDVTDATSPRGISELEIHLSVRAIKVVGPRAFVLGYGSACRGCADHDAMLTIVDVSRPKTPSVLSDYRLRDAAGNLVQLSEMLTAEMR
jgi:hypothetical protein